MCGINGLKRPRGRWLNGEKRTGAWSLDDFALPPYHSLMADVFSFELGFLERQLIEFDTKADQILY